MKARCTNPNVPQYKHYGARGIVVCERWVVSFEAFFEDIGPRPLPGFTLDRIDNNGHYEPGNVKWSARTRQNRNRRNTLFVEYQGSKIALGDFCEKTGIPYHPAYYHIVRRGLSPDELATLRVRPRPLGP